MNRVLVLGRGGTGQAVIAWLERAGVPFTVHDDGGAAPATDDPVGVLAGHDLVVPSPGVPEHHPVLRAAAAAGITVRSEIDLAAEHVASPFAAITGTNGKTTVTTLTNAMLEASGIAACAAGNIGRPFLAAVDDCAPAYTVEVSSFQLRYVSDAFRPRVAVWTNLAADHLDWHGSPERYAAAKARIFEFQRAEDTFVFNADDPVVSEAAARAPSQCVGFTLTAAGTGLWRVADGAVTDPDGRAIVAVAELPVRAPHDVANVLAAAAAARAMGASDAAIVAGAQAFPRLPHRMVPVGQAFGVEWVNDSKATNPHAAIAAVRAYERVVLIAGGANKGLDLSELRDVADHVRSVVAIGDSSPDVVAAFAGIRPVEVATSMRDAVRAAARVAEPGDVVLLSPACASFDWYANYGERGIDFAAEVARHIETVTA